MPDDADVQVAADTFRMLSDKNRIKILMALLQGESSVNCLAELIEASPSAVSQHLAKLRLAGLVHVRREGTFAYYVAANSHVQRLLAEALSHVDHAAHGVDADEPHQHRPGRPRGDEVEATSRAQGPDAVEGPDPRTDAHGLVSRRTPRGEARRSRR
jgi:DNA-binding transcriptional ArsR family regulator